MRARRRQSRCACGGRPRPRPGRCGCILLDPAEVRHPDLAIYSQTEELSLGRQPTWDSPDILTNNWGPFRLMDEATVVVRNRSDVPAANGLVHYYTAPFGIGTPRTLLQTRSISLAPWEELSLLFPLDSVTKSGDPRVGVFVELHHPHDDNDPNDRGAQVHDGAYTSEVGRSHQIQIPVVNDSNFTREIRLDLLPGPLLCSVTPSVRVFAPWEGISARLDVEVPASIGASTTSPPQHGATVIARVESTLIGGVTRLVRVDA